MPATVLLGTAALRLAYGQRELATPSYDLALLAPRLLGVSALEVAAGAERAESGIPPASPLSPRVFSVVVGAPQFWCWCC